MSRRPRCNHSAAIEALADGKTIAEFAQKHDVHPNQVNSAHSVSSPLSPNE